jgi:hypothetical protein
VTTPRMNELVPCPACGRADVVFACNVCNGAREVPRYMAEKCIHPGCDESPFGRGPLCRKHGCIVCGEVMLADYEEEQLCDECGTANHRCTECAKPAVAIASFSSGVGPHFSCGDRACDKPKVLYTPLWHGYEHPS